MSDCFFQAQLDLRGLCLFSFGLVGSSDNIALEHSVAELGETVLS
jgi:hypothetical protein